jgi:putative spermidine/putrescine transport system ATP-binding protein
VSVAAGRGGAATERLIARSSAGSEAGAGVGLTLEQITKRYGAVTACEDVSLEVQDGEFISVLGPSGCGKTTLLRAIAGFVPLDRGRIVVDGVDITTLPPNKRSVGLVFQNYALWPHLTVSENLAFGLKIKRIPTATIRQAVGDTLELLGLGGLEARYPRELSGGQQQRVALARSLILKPTILLLDEPLSNLDRRLRAQMRVELKKLQQKLRITTLYVTHDQEEALSMSDRIALLDRGRVVQVGTPEEIYEGPSTSFVADFIGDVNVVSGEVVRRGAEASFRRGPLEVELAGGPHPGAANLFFRPERVVLWRERPGDRPNLYESQVLFRAYLGAGFRYEVDMAGVVVKADSPNVGPPIKPGERVYLEIRPEDCFLLR